VKTKQLFTDDIVCLTDDNLKFKKNGGENLYIQENDSSSKKTVTLDPSENFNESLYDSRFDTQRNNL
jgi:hypothetical protein